jgi:hypothetical protein
MGPDTSAEDAMEAQRAGRAACDLVKVLRKQFPSTWENIIKRDLLKNSTLAWIEEHDEQDREREKEEREKANRRSLASKAKAKLTPKERAVLGIY